MPIERRMSARRDPEAREFVRRHVGMRHGGGMRGERLGAAEADGELDHFEPVEKANASASPPLTSNEKVEPGALALPLEDRPVGMILRQKAEIPDVRDLGMIAQKLRHLARALGARRPCAASASPASASAASRCCGSHMVPRIVRMPRTGASSALRARAAAGDQIGMPADIFGQRGDDEVGAVRERRAGTAARASCCRRSPAGACRPRRLRPLGDLPARAAMSTRPLVGLAGVSR